ncbi:MULTISPECIES: hypothetical protein [Caldicellulosiruptor]|uniref:Lantibiotic n=2 Tax=Caldicellulosiruptor TaxID=44000 RepID=A0ABY7BDT5_9FIRM|nr:MULTISPECIES: hypothetical protein [Caldicellulosiruptor]WAM30568.1 hypothetical protein OTJ99_001324 [Caldicellulosiruptor naganoensis]WAM32768.1 hypothetical protein OTK00_001212 [Caldicellulosiruptor morganii]
MMEEKEKITKEKDMYETLTEVTFDELETIEEIITGAASGLVGCCIAN